MPRSRLGGCWTTRQVLQQRVWGRRADEAQLYRRVGRRTSRLRAGCRRPRKMLCAARAASGECGRGNRHRQEAPEKTQHRVIPSASKAATEQE